MRSLVEIELASGAPFALSHLAVDGRDLIAAGLAEGPELGRILQRLLDRVIDEPELNERDALLALVPAMRGEPRV
jgi:tRNA nucleotidyltransferase (CCA-adding enzyme)